MKNIQKHCDLIFQMNILVKIKLYDEATPIGPIVLGFSYVHCHIHFCLFLQEFISYECAVVSMLILTKVEIAMLQSAKSSNNVQ